MKTPKKQTAENYIKEIRRKTRRIFTSEQKIQIVIEALRAEMSVAEYAGSTPFRNPSFINGTKSSWKRIRNVYQAIPQEKPPVMK
jgi:transposase